MMRMEDETRTSNKIARMRPRGSARGRLDGWGRKDSRRVEEGEGRDGREEQRGSEHEKGKEEATSMRGEEIYEEIAE